MKPKKLVLNKKTVARLNADAMDTARGGYSEESCAPTLMPGCVTNYLCGSGSPICVCSVACTLPCSPWG